RGQKDAVFQASLGIYNAVDAGDPPHYGPPASRCPRRRRAFIYHSIRNLIELDAQACLIRLPLRKRRARSRAKPRSISSAVHVSPPTFTLSKTRLPQATPRRRAKRFRRLSR